MNYLSFIAGIIVFIIAAMGHNNIKPKEITAWILLLIGALWWGAFFAQNAFNESYIVYFTGQGQHKVSWGVPVLYGLILGFTVQLIKHVIRKT